METASVRSQAHGSASNQSVNLLHSAEDMESATRRLDIREARGDTELRVKISRRDRMLLSVIAQSSGRNESDIVSEMVAELVKASSAQIREALGL